MKSDNPCYKCELRTPECHAKCEAYAAFTEKLKARRKAIAEHYDKEPIDYTNDRYYQRIAKKKRRNRK